MGITDHIGMVYSGMGPDYRLLVRQARKIAQQYQRNYLEPIPTTQLVQRIAAVMQEYTQSGGVRPFGVSLLVVGWDLDRPYVFQCDPSGAYFPWKATAMGKNYINGKTFLEKRYNEDLEVDDAVHTAILTLKESFEGQMNKDNIEIGVSTKSGFRRYDTPRKVQEEICKPQTSKYCEKFTNDFPYPVEKQNCHTEPMKKCELESRTRPKKAKNYLYNKECKPVTRQVCENREGKKLRPVCDKIQKNICSYKPEETCKEEEKKY